MKNMNELFRNGQSRAGALLTHAAILLTTTGFTTAILAAPSYATPTTDGTPTTPTTPVTWEVTATPTVDDMIAIVTPTHTPTPTVNE